MASPRSGTSRRTTAYSCSRSTNESALNLYAEEDFALQESFYNGVPESLVALVRDRPENYESLNLTDSTTGRTIHYAGGVFW
ncbi:hypothetical protein LV779_36355 [Streptomyces thinghirensis]|nr:hypothetical protein [Streptomyces thinghirensis]